MQMAFYSIPARGDSGLQEDLNRFLRSHRVPTVHREFVPLTKPRVDYKEVLSTEDFALFAKLRDWRKTKAGYTGR